MAFTPALVSNTWAGRPVTCRCIHSTPNWAVMMNGNGSGMRQASARYPDGEWGRQARRGMCHSRQAKNLGEIPFSFF